MNQPHLKVVARAPKDPAGRPPPQDLDGEQQLLSYVTTWGDMRGLRDLVAADDFFGDDNRVLWAMALELDDQETDPSARAITTRLRDLGQLTPGAERVLAGLARLRAQRQGLDDVARRIALLAVLRRLQGELWHALAKSYEPETITRAQAWMQETLQAIARLAHQGRAITQLSMQDATTAAVDTITSPATLGVLTGFRELDAATGGLHRKELTLLSGPTGRGKSAFATRVCRMVAGDEHPVLVFQLEDSAASYATRLMIQEALADADALRTGTMDHAELGSLLAAGDVTRKLPIHIVQADEAITPQTILGEAQRYQARLTARRQRVALIVVDYLQLINGRSLVGERETRERELSLTAKFLLTMAEKLDVPVLALCQTNGEGEIRESRAIQQHAQNWWDIQRPKPGKHHRDGDPEHAFVRVRKQRHGRADVTAPFWFHARSVLFSDLQQPELGR